MDTELFSVADHLVSLIDSMSSQLLSGGGLWPSSSARSFGVGITNSLCVAPPGSLNFFSSRCLRCLIASQCRSSWKPTTAKPPAAPAAKVTTVMTIAIRLFMPSPSTSVGHILIFLVGGVPPHVHVCFVAVQSQPCH